ncbi:unnamed protein product [Nesidiocoris tenuis]|uniref:Uncharacterized protein n=1 Tax=Nesidiocoris tenuis TaxID=355587 RepID=A0A6H5H429_9HEMI|nr:unnamed protein product [Nesidiocoris tenuis]
MDPAQKNTPGTTSNTNRQKMDLCHDAVLLTISSYRNIFSIKKSNLSNTLIITALRGGLVFDDIAPMQSLQSKNLEHCMDSEFLQEADNASNLQSHNFCISSAYSSTSTCYSAQDLLENAMCMMVVEMKYRIPYCELKQGSVFTVSKKMFTSVVPTLTMEMKRPPCIQAAELLIIFQCRANFMEKTRESTSRFSLNLVTELFQPGEVILNKMEDGVTVNPASFIAQENISKHCVNFTRFNWRTARFLKQIRHALYTRWRLLGSLLLKLNHLQLCSFTARPIYQAESQNDREVSPNILNKYLKISFMS